MAVETINSLANVADEEIGISEICETPICRICLQEEIDMNSLISPCQCSGSSKYVHRECLNEWRRTSRNPLAMTQCMICRTTYQVRRMEHHHFHDSCIKIKYNGCVVFIYHQLLSIMMTLLYMSSQSLQSSNSRSPYDAKDMGSKTVFDSIYKIYLYNILVLWCPIIVYTTYVFARYARNKRKVCSYVFHDGFPTCLSCIFCAACTFLVVPDFIFLPVVLGTLIIDSGIVLLFEKIDKVNRRYPQEIIIDMDIAV